MAIKKRFPDIHPGEVLGEELMRPLGLSACGLAREIDVPPNRITDILNGEGDISAGTALLLGSGSARCPSSG